MGNREQDAVAGAGTGAVVSGALFAVVTVYLYGVLIPAGLTIDMFDDPPSLLQWTADHQVLYLTLYLLYALQQLVFLPTPLLVWRYRGDDTGAWVRTAAAIAGTLSAFAALVSNGMLIMATHTGVHHAREGGAGPEIFEAAADLAKGVRLIGEPLLGVWVVWIGVALARSATGRLGHAWYAITAVGVWTVVVGVWKLLDPSMPFEDWIAALWAVALVAIGIGLRPRRRTAMSAGSTP